MHNDLQRSDSSYTLGDAKTLHCTDVQRKGMLGAGRSDDPDRSENLGGTAWRVMLQTGANAWATAGVARVWEFGAQLSPVVLMVNVGSCIETNWHRICVMKCVIGSRID